MARIKRLVVVALVLLVAATSLAACGAASEPPMASYDAAAEVQNESGGMRSLAPEEAPAPAQPAEERLIIRNGSITMVVEDTRAAQESVEAMVAGMAGEGAFVVSVNEFGATEGEQPQIVMSIRVPAGRFDEAMARLAELAVQVKGRNESAQDVTEEYVDLEARLESLEAARQRLLEIMNEARTTEDLLRAEEQLTQREAEIESLKGRMQYLSQSAKLASISIELQPYLLNQPVGGEWHPLETARRAVEALLDGLRALGDFAIVFAIAILPWLLVVGLVLYVIVRLIRKRSRAKESDRPSTDQSSGPAA